MNINWEVSIVIDLFLGGVAVGCYFFAVLFPYFHENGGMGKISKIAAVLSPLCLIAALISLTSHLGMPFRAFNVFLNFNPLSMIAWGTLLQTLFLGFALLYAFLTLKHKEGSSPPSKVGLWGIPFALGVGLYHGLLLVSFNAKPVWNSGLIVIMAVLGFITTGIALVTLAAKLMGNSLPEDFRGVYHILVGSLLLQIAAVVSWIFSMLFGPQAAKMTMLKILDEFVLSFWIIALAIGLIIPALIGIRDIVKTRNGNPFKLTAPAMISFFILIGGFFLRYVILIGGQ